MAKEKSKDEPVELHLSRTIAAPLAVVFKAWTDPKQVAKWWGPKGFTNPVCRVDAKAEGTMQIDMTGPDGTVYPMRGIFHEVVKNVSLTFSTYAFDDDRKRAGLINHNTVAFSEQDGMTTIDITVRVVHASKAVAFSVAGMSQGWNESLDRLTKLIGEK